MPSGIWGYFNRRNRPLSHQILKILIDHYLAEWYASYPSDEHFLASHIWPLARHNATIHDSFFCEQKTMGDPGSIRPFPIELTGHDGYVGQERCFSHDVSTSPTSSLRPTCPKICRPEEHRDEWLFCWYIILYIYLIITFISWPVRFNLIGGSLPLYLYIFQEKCITYNTHYCIM